MTIAIAHLASRLMPTSSHLLTARPSEEARAGFGSRRRGALNVLESDVILGEGGGRLLRRTDEGALRELQLDIELVVP
jgi:hypothetical protein